MNATSTLDRFIPAPRLRETDHVDVRATLGRAWQATRNLDAARAPAIRALFALRTLPARLSGGHADTQRMRIEDITSSMHGFRVLDERPGTSIAIGAIGKVWQPDIEYADLATAIDFAAFAEPGWAKVAWELRCEPLGQQVTRIILELRVSATDEQSWQRFRRYFTIVGPFSHFIRRQVLAMLARELGEADAAALTAT